MSPDGTQILKRLLMRWNIFAEVCGYCWHFCEVGKCFVCSAFMLQESKCSEKQQPLWAGGLQKPDDKTGLNWRFNSWAVMNYLCPPVVKTSDLYDRLSWQSQSWNGKLIFHWVSCVCLGQTAVSLSVSEISGTLKNVRSYILFVWHVMHYMGKKVNGGHSCAYLSPHRWLDCKERQWSP